MNTGSMLNLTAVPSDLNVNCKAPAPLPTLTETLMKTSNVLTDCQSIASKIMRLLTLEECLLPTETPPAMVNLSMDNADRAIALMHTLEQILSTIGQP